MYANYQNVGATLLAIWRFVDFGIASKLAPTEDVSKSVNDGF
jgi:hypothetical protein